MSSFTIPEVMSWAQACAILVEETTAVMNRGSSIILRQVLSMKLELSSQQAPGTALSLPLRRWDYRHNIATIAIYIGVGGMSSGPYDSTARP